MGFFFPRPLVILYAGNKFLKFNMLLTEKVPIPSMKCYWRYLSKVNIVKSFFCLCMKYKLFS